MVSLRIVSDLHVNYQRDQGRSLAAEITLDTSYDVLVIAGDLCDFDDIYRSLEIFCLAAAPRPVVYVLGNHEGIGGTWVAAVQEARRAAATHDNLHVLEQQVVELLGQRFVGCTLWFCHDGEVKATDGEMPDFQHIRDLRDRIYDLGRSSRAFLKDNVREGDVVITHHLPHLRSVPPEYAGAITDRYFVHNMAPVVERAGAALWVHGHTHTSCDYVAGTTRVVCNPFGYVHPKIPHEPNRRFDPALTIKV
jgi:predicted phosphodiesterase